MTAPEELPEAECQLAEMQISASLDDELNDQITLMENLRVRAYEHKHKLNSSVMIHGTSSK